MIGHQKTLKAFYRFLAGTAFGLLAPQPVMAQTAPRSVLPVPATATDEGQLADVIVTAQRRSERLQDVPIPITAADAPALAQQRVFNVENIASISPSCGASRAQWDFPLTDTRYATQHFQIRCRPAARRRSSVRPAPMARHCEGRSEAVTALVPSSFETALSELARRIEPGARGITGLRRLSGGATQEIWRFALDGMGDGAGDEGAELILRRAPGGDRVHDKGIGLAMEARLLAAAAAGQVPVPGVRHVLTEADGLGQGFVMDFVAGETLGGRIVRSEALASARPLLARQCGAILAAVHRIDPADFPALDRLSPADLVAQWHSAYRQSGHARPVFELALRWLADRCPPAPAKPSLVHGDFRNGNLIIGPDGVRAVLDWELAHAGDRHEDLAWLCVNSWRFGRIDKPVGGFGDRADLFEGYEAAGGAAVDRNAVAWWEVFGSLRWGAMCAGSVAGFRTDDPSPERAMIARRTSETEIDLLRSIAA